jgi:hypothetical protein
MFSLVLGTYPSEIWQQYRALDMTTKARSIVAGNIQLAIQLLLCSAQYLYIVDSETVQLYTQNTFLRFHCNDGYANAPKIRYTYRGAVKTLARPTSFSIFFSVQGTGRSPKGPDPENRVGGQDTGSPGRPVSFGLQVPGEPFPSWSG